MGIVTDMGMGTDVVCVGQSCVDILIRGWDLTEPFEGESKQVEQLELCAGGDATNQSMVMARLGLKTRLVSGIGEDNFGALLEGIVRQAGTDTSAIARSGLRRTSATVLIVAPDGQRNFVSASTGCALSFEPDLRHLEGARAVSIASIMIEPFASPESVERVAAAARKNGSIVCADVIFSAARKFSDFAPALRGIDYFFPNDYEAKMLTGKSDVVEMANAFLDCGIGNVIVKTGKSGCFFKSRKESFAMPAYDVPAVDTTGAGDNFASGFIAALLDGKDHMECCRYGHAVAGVSVQTVGANTGVRSREQVERFISAHGQGRG